MENKMTTYEIVSNNNKKILIIIIWKIKWLLMK